MTRPVVAIDIGGTTIALALVGSAGPLDCAERSDLAVRGWLVELKLLHPDQSSLTGPTWR